MLNSPFPYNFHSHTRYCDGSHDPEEYIIAVLEKGYKSYGYSSHAPIPSGSVWNMKEADLQEYLAQIDFLKKKYIESIEIYCGLEIDFIQGVQGPSKYQNLVDYTIGSIHFIGHGERTKLFEMDGSYSKFLLGIENHYENNIRKAVEHYFALTMEMIENDPPDILGHIDKICTQIYRFDPKLLQSKWYIDLQNELAQILWEKDIIVEINTRGLKLQDHPTTYPDFDFLKILHQKPIRFQMNADVHHINDLDTGYEKGLELCKEIGIKELWVLENSKWQAKRI